MTRVALQHHMQGNESQVANLLELLPALQRKVRWEKGPRFHSSHGVGGYVLHFLGFSLAIAAFRRAEPRGWMQSMRRL
jgi:hypothetical protein